MTENSFDKGLFMVGLPDQTLEIIRAASRKTGKSIVELIAEGIAMVATKYLQPPQAASGTNEKGKNLPR